MTTDSPERIWLIPELGDPKAGEWLWASDLEGMEDGEIEHSVQYVRADLCRPDRSPAPEREGLVDQLADALRAAKSYHDHGEVTFLDDDEALIDAALAAYEERRDG